MVAQAVTPFRTTESLMGMTGVVFAVLGAAVMGAVIATDSDHIGSDNLTFIWLVPLLSLLFLVPALAGAALIPTRSWVGGVLLMGNAALLLVGGASASGVGFPLGLVFLPGVVLMWRAGARAVARQNSEEIALTPRPFLVWTAGSVTPILAFLLLASRWYMTCTAFSDGTEDCDRQSLGAEPLVFGLIAVCAATLALLGLLLANLRIQGASPFAGTLARGAALFPLAGAGLGLVALWMPLSIIGVIVLALIGISFVLFFLPTQSRERA
ncbi:MAG: hypothetical protein HYS09_09110 [Chloroflexi bacterium]|nr:hypothetical protein [Chloroflexota bacterium]